MELAISLALSPNNKTGNEPLLLLSRERYDALVQAINESDPRGNHWNGMKQSLMEFG
jgi:hypothetical protein